MSETASSGAGCRLIGPMFDTPLTDDELTAIEARANAATGGPWTPSAALSETTAKDPGIDIAIVSAALPRAWGLHNPFVAEVFAERTYRLPDNEQAALDAAFICGARADVPALVAELRNTRNARENLHRAAKEEVERLTGQLAARDAQIARLRQIVEGAEVTT